MDNMTPEFEEIYGNRRKTIERLKERNKKFAELTRVEFKRVILHIAVSYTHLTLPTKRIV